jgi:hypothetical protein
MSTNAYIIDQITNREIDGIRVANNTAANATSGLFSLYKEIQRLLAKTPTSQWYRLSNDIEALLVNEMRGAVKEVKADFDEFALIEARFVEKMLVTATTIDTIGRTPASILAAFTSAPMNHFVQSKKVTTPTVSSLLSKMGKDNARAIRNEVRKASLEGSTAQKVARSIRHLVVDTTRRQAESTILTVFNHYSNQAKQAVYSENADILQGIKLIATLDSGTTLTCMGYDQTKWPLNSGPRPPFHYNCRTQAVPDVIDELKLTIKGRTRASETGPVNAALTYDGFLRRQGKERQNEILGPTRARLFRQGMPISKFTNDRGVKLLIKNLPDSYN